MAEPDEGDLRHMAEQITRMVMCSMTIVKWAFWSSSKNPSGILAMDKISEVVERAWPQVLQECDNKEGDVFEHLVLKIHAVCDELMFGDDGWSEEMTAEEMQEHFKQFLSGVFGEDADVAIIPMGPKFHENPNN